MAEMVLTGRVLFPDGILRPGRVVVTDGVISAIEPGTSAPDQIISPGWIDLQVNGAFGCDFTAEPETIEKAAAQLPRTGITSFLPTIITSPLEKYPEVLAAFPPVAAADGDMTLQGARILGLHFEGPYLSFERRGAHNPAFLRGRADPLGDGLLGQPAAVTPVRLVTLAPELEYAQDAIRALRALGIVASLGHSAASFAEAKAGIDAGATYGTHLFNAMSPLGHREPGMVGALLANQRVAVGVIADGVHVHPSIFKWLVKVKGALHITLVTDAIAAVGLGEGRYVLGDRQILVDRVSARLADGTLAGSILTMDQAVRNFVKWEACTLEEALQMASAAPASVLGLDWLGRIAPGCPADLVILDRDLRVQQTFVAGHIQQ